MMKRFVLLVLVAFTAFMVLHLSKDPLRGGWTPTQERPTFADPPVRQSPILLNSSKDCRPCHEEVYREWEQSHHRISYTNPEVQLLSTGFQGEGLDCLPCHLPRPVPETGFGVRPLERAVRHDEGVDCMTCHHHPKSHVMLGAGPLTAAAKDAPCQPEVHPAISSMDLCAPCHNQHKVHEEWRQSRYAVTGADYKDCNDCHMPEIDRLGLGGEARKGRSHAFPGAHDPEMLRSAATFEFSKIGSRELRLHILNSGAGHNFPADERHRAVDVHLIAKGLQGPIREVRAFRFRNPYRQDFEYRNPLPKVDSVHEETLDLGPLGAIAMVLRRIPSPYNPVREIWYERSTQIPEGEAREFQFSLPPSVLTVTVKAWYRKKPNASDEESVLLYEKTLDL
jgi:hypothetical protein